MKFKNENIMLWYFIIINLILRINDLFIGFFNFVCYRFFICKFILWILVYIFFLFVFS